MSKIAKKEGLDLKKGVLPANPSKVTSTMAAPTMTKDPTKVGKQGLAAKTPKMKKPKDAFAPPSVFFQKSEDFKGPKHTNLRNLWDFLNKRHKK